MSSFLYCLKGKKYVAQMNRRLKTLDGNTNISLKISYSPQALWNFRHQCLLNHLKYHEEINSDFLMNILDFILHDKEYQTNFNYLTFINLGSVFFHVSKMSCLSTEDKLISYDNSKSCGFSFFSNLLSSIFLQRPSLS